MSILVRFPLSRVFLAVFVPLVAVAIVLWQATDRPGDEWDEMRYPANADASDADAGIHDARITVDARAKERWQTVRFSDGGVIALPGLVLPDWDIAFRRFQVVTNSGATNPAGRAGVRDMGAVPFDAIAEAPMDGYLKDEMAGDRVETENPAVKRWYEYDYYSHRLKPKPNVYAVRASDGRFAKFQILSYYGPGKEAGLLTIRFSVTPVGSGRFQADGRAAWK